ncbi:hypothetical protein N7462_010953 [Penicillium macrosclerotiorum]|uniref:uncharacterized protein n=1 Tax=Penicillium macrosclerotiorum TaxID=303699 RepID=UPI002547B63E|nr:uncharacterized protein N7462_010953 [Penicillium macrosclerotiorum]KAJ5669883.1 hypothetical protein N7462_010953 [Penicillium macrosclerotiorum]
MDPHRESRNALFYQIPSRELVSVEHPAVIRNIDRAIETLQSNVGIQKILNPVKPNASANLILRPEDAMARPILSTSLPSNNVLLKVTVPKRTGRKRRRGSGQPFTDAEPSNSSVPDSTGEISTRRTAKDLLRSLMDNPSSYTIEAVGKVERTHVFRGWFSSFSTPDVDRLSLIVMIFPKMIHMMYLTLDVFTGMPDFVYSTTNSAFTNKFRDLILPYDLEKLKQFDIDMSKGATKGADLIPPPVFSQTEVPFQYIYRQNPTVRKSVGQSGEITTVNTQQAQKVHTHLVVYDAPEVPSSPHPDMPPLETLESNLRSLIDHLAKLFEQRPAWTRRALRNYLTSDEQRSLLRHAVPYVGYVFRSGPWRDAILKLGHDPRTDPAYRDYQTFMFRLIPRENDAAREGTGGGRRYNPPRLDENPAVPSTSAGAPDTHLFRSELPLPRDGRIWMACDIKDPLLAGILYPDQPAEDFLRPTCEVITDGWFGNGVMGKVKTIMRAKIQMLIENRQPRDADFRQIVAFPDHAVTEADLAQFTVDLETASSREIQLATEVRASIKGAPLWRRVHDLPQTEGDKYRGRGPARSRKGKSVVFEEPELDDDDDDDEEEEESEGEEEEMERTEMLEAQVAAALAARAAADTKGNGEEGENAEGHNETDDN